MAQIVHCCEPAAAAAPAPQGSQDPAPGAAPNLPLGHNVQFWERAGEKEPDVQGAQADDPLLLKVPGRQGVQTELELAPATLLLVPALQGVHCVAFAALK